MSTEASVQPNVAQQRISEFLKLLPLTLEIAGLPKAERGHNFNEGQMDVRASTIKQAYKVARQILIDLAK